MAHLVWIILVGVYGACIGSFLNVVIYRLPAGQSLMHPGSRCPACGHPVAWHDNLPILGWLILRGRCRHCRAPISIQYPIVETVTALLFVGLYWLYYMSGLFPRFMQPGLTARGDLMATWPVLVVHLGLLAGLLAASVIDARHYIIPLPATTTIVLLAALLYPLGTMMQAIPTPSGLLIGAGVANIAPTAYAYYVLPNGHTVVNICGIVTGALLGLVVGNLLLMLRVIPRSFEDEGTEALGHGADVPSAPGAPGGDAAGATAGSPDSSIGPGPESHSPSTPASGKVECPLFEGATDTSGRASPDLPAGTPGAPDGCTGLGPGRRNAAVPATEKVECPLFEGGPATGPDTPLFGTPEQWLAYPHARREVLIELLFLGWPVLGAILGNFLMPIWNFHPTQGQVPLVLGLFVLMGVALGYLVGGAVVWLTRVLGTLAFGKEAMGLGDVHLMAAIGAVLGWRGALVAFFLAPFGGLIGAAVLLALRRVGGKPVRVVPYGPYMAVAAVVSMVFGDRILALLGLMRH